MAVFGRRTSLGRTIGEIVATPLQEAKVSPLVVDVGARNGMFLLPSAYSAMATLVGFEPNPDEYRKLAKGETDMHSWAAKNNCDIPKFREQRYFDCAVWDRECSQTLYITQGPGACTLMGPTLSLMKSTYFLYPWGDPRRRQSVYDLHTRVVEESEIRCKPLDALFGANEKIDFLKVDVEGGELKVFKGAQALFEGGQILFVQAEFQAFPYYQDHAVFGDQHAFLSRNGMRLIDLNLEHSRYRRGDIDVPDECSRLPLFSGDALFVIDPDRNDLSPMDRQRVALVLLAFGFNSLALSLLVEARLLTDGELAAISKAITSRPDKSPKRRLLDAWNRVPVAAYETFTKLKRRLRSRG